MKDIELNSWDKIIRGVIWGTVYLIVGIAMLFVLYMVVMLGAWLIGGSATNIGLIVLCVIGIALILYKFHLDDKK